VADRQVVDEAEDIGDGQVVVGLGVVGAEVVGVLRGGCVALERGAGVVSECAQVKELSSVRPSTKRCS